MKTTRFLSAAFMAAALFGCSQEEQFGMIQEGQMQFTGAFEQVNSRVTMDSNYMMNWENEDLVSIFPGITVNNQYKVSGITNGRAGFAFVDYVEPVDGKYDKTTDKYNYAVYPYADANSITADGTITTETPAEFAYDGMENSIRTALMAAKSSDGSLSFKNVQGILRLRLNAKQPLNYGAVKAIKLQSATKALSGTVTITFDDANLPVATLATDGGKTLTLNLSSELQKSLPKADGGGYDEFYIPMVPASFEANDVKMTIDWLDDEKADYEKVVTIPFNIERRKIYTLRHTIGADESFGGGLEGNEEVWDGVTVTVPTPVTDPITGEEYYPVEKASDLPGIAALVNGTATSRATVDYSKIQIRLMNDIDLGGCEWTPIGLNGNRFMGAFDGQGYTIRNFKISTADNGAQAALFGDVNIATIQNFTLDNAQILYPSGYSNDFYGAAVVSQAYMVTLKDITVKNSTIQGNNKVAGILAHDADGAAMIIENCHVEGCVIETKNDVDGGNAGGIVGSVQGSKSTKSLVNCSVKNTTFNVVNSADAGKRSNGQMVGTVIATAETVLTLENCVVEGNTFNQTGVSTYETPYDGIFIGGARTEETGKVVINGMSYLGKAADLATVLTSDVANINVILTSDIDLPITSLGQITGGSGEYKLGGESTNNINLNLGGKKLNITTTYWSAIGAKNDNAIFTIENGTMTSSSTSGTWNSYDLTFANCNYVFEDVYFSKSIAFTNAGKTATLTNVTINETHDYYALWITAEGQTVNIDDLTVNSKGRGIKIDEEYVDASKVKLSVSNSSFTTEKKAAILVKSVAGADITLSNIDITNVAADTEYAVWVDEDAKQYASLVTVTGGKVLIEGYTSIADGVMKDDEDNYEISNKAGMQWFADEVNVNKNAFSGKTVKLCADIDLAGIDWEPIGQTGTTFNGVFDGQNYTISNLSVDSENQTGVHYSSGLFGWVETHAEGNGHLKNVKISGATIKGHHNCGALVGYITEKYALVENCHVAGATISCTYANGDADGDKAGALIGNATDATLVKNCTVSNSTVSAGRDAGQVIGAGKEANVTGCSVTEVTVIANGTGTGANVRNEVIGRLL